MTARQAMYADYVARTAEKKPRSYLVSDSVRDCRLSDSKPLAIRVKGRVGITGGYVDGGRDDGSQTATATTTTRKRQHNRGRAAKRAAYRGTGYHAR